MSLPVTVDLTLYRGDDEPFVATILDDSGAAMNLTGCALAWTLKEARNGQPVGNAVLTLTWSQSGPVSGIAVSDVTTGVAAVSLTHGQTATLKPTSRYVYDLQVTDAGGAVTTVATGAVSVTPDVSA